MDIDVNIKQQVKDFYDQVGWMEVAEGLYQNAHYEDLRPVSRDYIHRCHLRLLRHLKPSGRFLLDAGSGPIQYSEYLEYSKGYSYRVCADISITALKEARRRVGRHGLFVVCDVANLPFRSGAFDGVVSLHTIHHLPEDEHQRAYTELFRSLAPGSTALVVNGWPGSRLMRWAEPWIRLSRRIRNISRRLLNKNGARVEPDTTPCTLYTGIRIAGDTTDRLKGTFTSRHDAVWLEREVGSRIPLEIRVWRSVSVRGMRALVYPWLGGRFWLALLYWLEERFPHWFGVNGQYPLIILRKTE